MIYHISSREYKDSNLLFQGEPGPAPRNRLSGSDCLASPENGWFSWNLKYLAEVKIIDPKL